METIQTDPSFKFVQKDMERHYVHTVERARDTEVQSNVTVEKRLIS